MKKAFTLIEMVVSIVIIALLAAVFAPNYSRGKERDVVDRTADQIVNGIYRTRNFAIAGRGFNARSKTGRIAQTGVIVMNITSVAKTYTVGSDDCIFPGGKTEQEINPKSFKIFTADNIAPCNIRHAQQEVKLSNKISVFFNFPCHARDTTNFPVGAGCPNTSTNLENSDLWKASFRNTDGMIGFAGRYFDDPTWLGGLETGYWIEDIWGDASTTKESSDIVVVYGSLSNPEEIYDTQNCINGLYNGRSCRKISINNITGAVNVE